MGNIAGVGILLVQGLRRRGIRADLIGRVPHRYNFPTDKVLNVSHVRFVYQLLKICKTYDIIHVHGLSYVKVFNVDVFLLKLLRKKLIIHLHGTEIRESYNKASTKLALRVADQVIVSTSDLLRYYKKAVWLPNPIDPVFKPLKHTRHGALYFKHWYEPDGDSIVKEKCREMNLELTVVNPEENPIAYAEMPYFLNRFEVLFDQFTIPSLSKTALEALACGCKVMSWEGPVTHPEKILKNHSLPVVTERLIETYKN